MSLLLMLLARRSFRLGLRRSRAVAQTALFVPSQVSIHQLFPKTPNSLKILQKPGNEEQRAKINRMLVSLPPDQASILRERFGLPEVEAPLLEEFARVLQAMAPGVIWQRFGIVSRPNLLS